MRHVRAALARVDDVDRVLGRVAAGDHEAGEEPHRGAPRLDEDSQNC